MSLSYSLLDTEVKEYVGVTLEGEEGVDFSGNKLDYAAPSELTAVVNYDWSMFGDYTASIGMDGKYSDAAEGELSNSPIGVRPSYFVLNARAGFRPDDGPWNIQAYVRNLTDEVYFNSTQYQIDVYVRYSGKPRVYGMRLDYEF